MADIDNGNSDAVVAAAENGKKGRMAAAAAKARGRKRAAADALGDALSAEPSNNNNNDAAEVEAAAPRVPDAEAAVDNEVEDGAAAAEMEVDGDGAEEPAEETLKFGDLLMSMADDGGQRYWQVVRVTARRAAAMRVGVAARSQLPRLNAYLMPEDAPEQLVRLGATAACHVTSGRLFWRCAWPTDEDHEAAAAGRAAGWADPAGWLRAYVTGAYESRDRVARLYAAEKELRSAAARERIKRARRDAPIVGAPAPAADPIPVEAAA